MEKKDSKAILAIVIALVALLLLMSTFIITGLSSKNKASVDNLIDPLKSLGSNNNDNGLINIFDSNSNSNDNNDEDPTIYGLPDFSLSPGDNMTLGLEDYSDDDQDSTSELTFDVDNEIHSDSPSPFNVSLNYSTNELTVSAANGSWTGSETVTITIQVIDTDGNTDEDTFVVSLSTGSGGVNDPTITPSIPDVTFAEDGFDSSIDLDDYVVDNDNNDSEINWTYSGNTNVIVSIDNSTHVVTFTATADWNGNETIIFTATDPLGGFDTDTIDVIVTPVDDAAVWSALSNQSIVQDSALGTVVYSGITSECSDIDSAVVISVSPNVNFNLSLSGSDLILSALTSGWNGNEIVNLDCNGVSASFTLTVTPTGGNSPPTLTTALPDVTINEDEGFVNDVIGDLNGYFTDIDSNLTFTITSQTGANIVTATIDAGNRIDLQTLQDMFGTSDVTVEADDGVNPPISDTFRITVIQLNDDEVCEYGEIVEICVWI